MARFVRVLGVATALLPGHSQAAGAQVVAGSFTELRGVVRPDTPITVMDSRFFGEEGQAR